jgi:hypothetical protein
VTNCILGLGLAQNRAIRSQLANWVDSTDRALMVAIPRRGDQRGIRPKSRVLAPRGAEDKVPRLRRKGLQVGVGRDGFVMHPTWIRFLCCDVD